MGTWCEEVAPSKELREWYQRRAERFDEFAERYEAELRDSPAVAELRRVSRRSVISLVTATRELDMSQSTVLAKPLKSR